MNNEIEVSFVLPCLNEEKAIGICIDKIKGVFAKEGLRAEVVVCDNGSIDRSREVAQGCGARVVVEPRRGYGAAYLCGIKEAKGKYIVIADSDDTYDFGAIPEFINKLKQGYDFVMGSRFMGKMDRGAMSWSHRYVGNPILSGICRVFFSTRLSDIHCGMRAFTARAFEKMQCRTLGMEFATEMVVNAIQNKLKISEVPVDYHLRIGKSKLNPFRDAWRHMRFMLLFCPLWLYFIPGAVGLSFGFAAMLLLLRGPFMFLGHQWDIHLVIFASLVSIFSYQVVNIGVYAHAFAIRQEFLKPTGLTSFFQKYFNLERGIIIGGIIFLIGLGINLAIVIEWFRMHFGALHRIRESVLAMTLLVIGLQTVFSSFFLSLIFLERK